MIASTAGTGAPLLVSGLVVVVAVVTLSVTGSAIFFESFVRRDETPMLWVLPSAPWRTGDWTAPATAASSGDGGHRQRYGRGSDVCA